MDNNNLQLLVDGMSARLQRQRAVTQMTLGKLIAAIEAIPADTEIEGINSPHSYRGYYADLAFKPMDGRVKAGDLLAMCKGAMGQVFCGYKGGDYMMGALTPVWIASYGCCGKKLMALRPDGTFEATDDPDYA